MNDQELNKASHAAFNVHTNRTFGVTTEEELNQMLIALVQIQAKGLSHPWVKQAIESFEQEIARRQREKHHTASLQENQKLLTAIQEPKEPHWTLTPGFAVLVLTMIFAAIAAWPVIREWLPTSQPANKAASSQSSQSNSAPAKPEVQKTSPIAPAAIQDTNQVAR